MSTSGKAPARKQGSRRWVRRWIPPQHGAWAMLLVPFLLGLAVSGVDWTHLPLVAAWLLGYLTSWAASRWAASRFAPRFRRPVIAYGIPLLPLVALVLIARPRLVVFGLVYAPLVGLTAWFAWRRQERSLANDVVAVVQAALMVLVVSVAAGAGILDGWREVLVCLLYFLGTIPHVKCMIRERDDPRWYRASVTWHALALPIAATLSLGLGVLFAVLLMRAIALPRNPPSVKTIGLVEVGISVLFLLTASASL